MAPFAADYFGRKPTIIWGAIVICGAGKLSPNAFPHYNVSNSILLVALQTASQNFGMFSMCPSELN